jgi:HEAT repeat protein
MMRLRLAVMASLAIAAGALRSADPAPMESADEKLLREAKLPTDSAGLLAYLRKQTVPADKKGRVPGLIKQLGDDSFKVREKASAELLAIGPGVLPQLRKVRQHPDPEVQDRVRDCLRVLEDPAKQAAAAAAVRVLRARAPEGTVPVLLAYSAVATDDVAEEVLAALASLAGKGEKINEGVVKALEDPEVGTRALAAAVLARAGTAEHRKSVQALLKDPEPLVRCRAAQGLLAARDRSGVPALIALLEDAPLELAERVRDQLCCLAGTRAPQAPLGDRKGCRLAWDRWWASGRTMDLSKADVDLPPFNPGLQALQVVRAFCNAEEKGDVAALKQMATLPFLAEDLTVRTRREDLDRMLDDKGMVPSGVLVTVTLAAVRSREELLRALPAPNRPTVQQTFLNSIPRDELRIVQVRMEVRVPGIPVVPGAKDPGAMEQGFGLVRIVNGQAKLVGILGAAAPGM